MPRSAVHELHHILRVSNVGDGLLGPFVADHLEELASALGVQPATLAALDLDEPDVRGRLRAAVTRAKDRHASARLVGATQRREDRGRALTAGARWCGGVVVLPVGALFDLASCAGPPVLGFETASFTVFVPRALLVRARAPLSRLPSPAAHLSAAALHLRWRAGRGGLDLCCPAPAPRDEPALVLRLDSPRAARAPALLREVLRDLGLTA